MKKSLWLTLLVVVGAVAVAFHLVTKRAGEFPASYVGPPISPPPFYPSPLAAQGRNGGDDCEFYAVLPSGGITGTCKYSGPDGYGFGQVVWSSNNDKREFRPISAVACYQEETDACKGREYDDKHRGFRTLIGTSSISYPLLRCTVTSFTCEQATQKVLTTEGVKYFPISLREEWGCLAEAARISGVFPDDQGRFFVSNYHWYECPRRGDPSVAVDVIRGIVAGNFVPRYPPGLPVSPPPKTPPYFLLLCMDADEGCVPEYPGSFPTAVACRDQVHAIQARSRPAAPEDKFVCTTNAWTLEPPHGIAQLFLSMEQCERVKDAVLAATPRTGPPVLRPDVVTGELIDVNAPPRRMCWKTSRLPAPTNHREAISLGEGRE